MITELSLADRLYPFRILLDLPVCHLTRATREWMQEQSQETARNGTAGGSILDIGHLPHGWYLRVRADVADRIPSDLNACMQKAAALGAHALLFDTDADLSPITGDLPVYDESNGDAVIPREAYEGTQIDADGPATGVLAVDVLVCVATDDEANIPCEPSLYGNGDVSETAFRDALKGEWAANPPRDDETDEPLPFPAGADNQAVHDRMADYHGSTWGQYKLVTGYVPVADLLTRGLANPGPTTMAAGGQAERNPPSASANADLPRIEATIAPQAWVDNHAVDVDPEGPTSWDVTAEVVALGREAALALRDNRDETDNLVRSVNAPDWVRHWRGPFTVIVEDAIRAYYDALDAAAHKLAA
jgi:hypothetical protein